MIECIVLALSEIKPINRVHKQSHFAGGVKTPRAKCLYLFDTLDNHERNHIMRALNETNWVIHGKKGAAELLGINPSTLHSRMEKLGIQKASPS